MYLPASANPAAVLAAQATQPWGRSEDLYWTVTLTKEPLTISGKEQLPRPFADNSTDRSSD